MKEDTGERLLNSAADYLASTSEEVDIRAWKQVLTYCPKELLVSHKLTEREITVIRVALMQKLGQLGQALIDTSPESIEWGERYNEVRDLVQKVGGFRER